MLATHQFTHIRVEVASDGVARALLDRPERLNAVDHDLHRDLADLFAVADRDPEVAALLVTGAGRAFSVGGDLKMMESAGATAEGVLEMLADGRRVITSLLDCRKPIVTAVKGPAMGIGCQIALLADVCVAAESAGFSDGHAIAGVAAGDGGALIWPLLVGMAQSKRFLLTGETMSSDEAMRLGLIAERVSDDELMTTAENWAHRLAEGPREAIAQTKLILNQWLQLGRLISLDYGLAAESLNFLTEDAKQRIAHLRQRL